MLFVEYLLMIVKHLKVIKSACLIVYYSADITITNTIFNLHMLK
jgi:hypothetical protein